jgi:glycosyltransferase involved in cell wall biosynthesis
MARSTLTTPILSAVICTHDRAEPLRLTLESLCRQTLAQEAFEVVIVDDGSTDGTREVVRAFESRLPLRSSYQGNAGLASARNHGVFLARGVIALFLDDDVVADPMLLEEHVETHRRFPEPRFAVLGCTRLDASIAADPLMYFVTEVGCFLFSYPHIKPGELLDFSYFWGGRSSCKRSFLLDHGVFNAVFRFGGEDIELAYRLSRHGFEVVYSPRAVSTMPRKFTVDDFCRRLYRQGQSNFAFSQLHEDPAVRQWAEIAPAGETWRNVAAAYDTIVRSARELDRIVRMRQEQRLPVDSLDLSLLHRSYWAAFRASKARGVVDKAKEMGHDLVGGARPQASPQQDMRGPTRASSAD